jgi:PIN domain nuclease of toxin-antitoxin system
MDILLDTATFLWWIAGDKKLPAATASVLRDPAHRVFLSAASSWEIAIKHAARKLPLRDDPTLFVPNQREKHDIELLPIGELEALQVGKLPELHRDPFDRMLVAQSIIHGLQIATSDPLIRQYPCRWLWKI